MSIALEQPQDVADELKQLSSAAEGFKMVTARRYLRKSQERRLTKMKHVEPLRARQLGSSSDDSSSNDSSDDSADSSDDESGGSSSTRTKSPTPALTFPPHLFDGTLAPSAAPTTLEAGRLSSTARASNLTAATVGGSFAAGFFLIFMAVGILFIRRRKNQNTHGTGGLTAASAIPVGAGAVGARVKSLSVHSDITLYDEK